MTNQRLNRLLRREPQVDEAEVELLQARLRARLSRWNLDDEASLSTSAGASASAADGAIAADVGAPTTSEDVLPAPIRLTKYGSPSDVVEVAGDPGGSKGSADVDDAREVTPAAPEANVEPVPQRTPPDSGTVLWSDADLPTMGTADELDAQIDRLLAGDAWARAAGERPSATSIGARAQNTDDPAPSVVPTSAPAPGAADGGTGSALSRLSSSTPGTRPWRVPRPAHPPQRPSPARGEPASAAPEPTSAPEPNVQAPANRLAPGLEPAPPPEVVATSAPTLSTIATPAIETPGLMDARTQRTTAVSSAAEEPNLSRTALADPTGPAAPPIDTPIDPPSDVTEAIVVAATPSPSTPRASVHSSVVAEGPRVTAKRRASVPVAPYCPYCALLLDPPPEVKRRCPRCREWIVVQRVAGRVVYLTEASVAVFHAERRRLANSGRWNRELRRWLKAAKTVDAPSNRIARLETAPISEVVVASARALYITTVVRSFRNAKREHRWEDASRIMREHALALSRIAGGPIPPPEEALQAHREAASAALRGIGELAREAELVSGRCCEACRADDGKTFRIALELRAPRLPHTGCPKGLCRCDWYLAVRDQSLVRKQLRRRARADASLPPGEPS